MLEASGFEIVRERGPLSEARMLELAGSFDAFLCGDDAITQAVIERSLPRLKIISKYGIGVDKIDVKYATAKQIPVLFTPGVNHTTVAEHTFLLLLALEQNFLYGVDASRKGEWKRKTGHEVLGKTIGIVGLGRIGKEVASRARAFGMQVVGYDIYWDEAFAQQYQVRRVATLDEIFAVSDYLSLHTNLTPETRDLVGAKNIAKMKKGVVILNCARGEIVHTGDMVEALKSGQVGGYGTDVLDAEPPPPDHPLLHEPNCIVTPHVASRTYESVVRQAVASVTNLLRAAKGEKPLAQVNPEVPVRPI
jgi:D-3-phosphoglycerate dehydrogenase